MLKFDLFNGGAYKMICCRGEIDYQSNTSFSNEIDKAIDLGNRKIVIDLSDVTYMDGAGIDTISKNLHRLKQMNGELALVLPNNHIINQLLRISGLSSLIRTFPDQAAVNQNGFLNPLT